MGKQRIIAETGAGQHGVAAATVCAKMSLDCVVYMGEEDMPVSHQCLPNEALGRRGAPVVSGSRTLKRCD